MRVTAGKAWAHGNEDSANQIDVNWTLVENEGKFLFGYYYDDPVKQETGRIFAFSDEDREALARLLAG